MLSGLDRLLARQQRDDRRRHQRPHDFGLLRGLVAPRDALEAQDQAAGISLEPRLVCGGRRILTGWRATGRRRSGGSRRDRRAGGSPWLGYSDRCLGGGRLRCGRRLVRIDALLLALAAGQRDRTFRARGGQIAFDLGDNQRGELAKTGLGEAHAIGVAQLVAIARRIEAELREGAGLIGETLGDVDEAQTIGLRSFQQRLIDQRGLGVGLAAPERRQADDIERDVTALQNFEQSVESLPVLVLPGRRPEGERFAPLHPDRVAIIQAEHHHADMHHIPGLFFAADIVFILAAGQRPEQSRLAARIDLLGGPGDFAHALQQVFAEIVVAIELQLVDITWRERGDVAGAAAGAAGRGLGGGGRDGAARQANGNTYERRQPAPARRTHPHSAAGRVRRRPTMSLTDQA